MTWERLFIARTIGFPFSPTAVTASAKSTLNATICKTSPRTRAGDSDHDGREHEWRDYGFDQIDKDVAQKINRVPPIGSQPADYSAGHQADHDLHRQRGAIPYPAYRLRNPGGHRR